MTSLLIDAHPGLDAAAGLMFALASDHLRVEAITIAPGETPVERAAEHANRVLDHLSMPPTIVALGARASLTGARDWPVRPDDGLAEMRLPATQRPVDPRFAPDLIVDLATARQGTLSIITLGPLTNLALALAREPALVALVDEVIVAGGVFGSRPAAFELADGGTPVTEWNIGADPEAARAVFASGLRIVALGLDVTATPSLALTDAHQRDMVAAGTPAARFFAGVRGYVERAHWPRHRDVGAALAVATVLDRHVVTTERVAVAVETAGRLTRGQTIVDRRLRDRQPALSTVDIATDVNTALLHELLLSTITRPRRAFF